MKPDRWMALAFAALAASSTAYVGREGWKLVAYPDPVHGAKVPTYCAGLTGGGVKVGQTFTEAECLRLTMLSRVEHISRIKGCVREDIPITPKTEAYLGNMSSTAENLGTPTFNKSSMCRQMQAGNYRAACDAILLYRYAGKVDCSDPNQRVCRGLWADRLKSHKACLEALPDAPR